MTNIVLFASGTGSNALNIINYFKNSTRINVGLVVSNKADAGVVQKANDNAIPVMIVNKEYFNTPEFIAYLKDKKIDFIVLAGFLWLIPPALVNAYKNKMINLHPALLPGFGGKGMFGMNVHKAVVAAQAPESGITIHYVNDQFDEGKVIFQATCKVAPDDTPETLADKIHQLEYAHFPRVIEETVLTNTVTS
jgi:phosphoribosylglycinamide formyltransferase 1